MRVEKWIDEMVPMTDKVLGQEMAIVTATRNAVDVRKWVVSRLMPNEYGDQPTGVTINNQTNVIVISDDNLRQLQETRRKMMLDDTWQRERESPAAKGGSNGAAISPRPTGST